MRNLILVLGDQLDANSAVWDGFDAEQDRVWMAETAEEATYVWCHKLRLAMFFSAMRHFADHQRQKGREVHYHQLTADPQQDRGSSFAELLADDVRQLEPQRLVVVEPGDYRVRRQLEEAAESLGVDLEVRIDRHFYCTVEQFREHAEGRKQLVLEYFYRELRKRHDVLLDEDGKPEGGQWNFDQDNRERFPKSGPPERAKVKSYSLDDLTLEVVELVESRFADHPGRLDHLNLLPLTRRQATSYLRHFIKHLLPDFGRWEDAMWTDEPFLFHSRLSAPLNLKLLSPQECVAAAVEAWQDGDAPLNSVEGFVRQILGWREFVRGVYWTHMPDYAERNFLGHELPAPQFFWDGETDMACVADAMQNVLNHGYSHHIQRLMVLGNYAQLIGVDPLQFHQWHMAMYVDAVDWVSLPNALGMSQFGDGGVVGTKPYCSSGNYIHKMSNYCGDCRYNYKRRTGEDACPFTTLYWEFLDRHYDQLQDNPRLNFAIKNLQRLREEKPEELEEIRQRAAELRQSHG